MMDEVLVEGLGEGLVSYVFATSYSSSPPSSKERRTVVRRPNPTTRNYQIVLLNQPPASFDAGKCVTVNSRHMT